MKKIIIIAAAFIALNTAANAQSANSSASQTVTLNLTDANSTNFSYTGATSPAPTMPVASVLSTKVSANSTGGSIGSGFSAYKAITTSNQDIITGATAGGNNLFSVQYEAQPGFAYPAGTYTVDVVYTATQL